MSTLFHKTHPIWRSHDKLRCSHFLNADLLCRLAGLHGSMFSKLKLFCREVETLTNTLVFSFQQMNIFELTLTGFGYSWKYLSTIIFLTETLDTQLKHTSSIRPTVTPELAVPPEYHKLLSFSFRCSPPIYMTALFEETLWLNAFLFATLPFSVKINDILLIFLTVFTFPASIPTLRRDFLNLISLCFLGVLVWKMLFTSFYTSLCTVSDCHFGTRHTILPAEKFYIHDAENKAVRLYLSTKSSSQNRLFRY